MRSFNRSPFATTLAFLGLSLLASCSDGGSVTTLKARPSIPVTIPAVLQNDGTVVQENLSPQIRLSNGTSVNLVKNDDGSWSGTINVTPGRNYIATITWVESLDGQDIPLASQTQSLEVSADGNVTRTDSNDYSTDIDTDSDGISNLDERHNGTNPLQADSSVANNPSDDGSTDSSSQLPTESIPESTPTTEVEPDSESAGDTESTSDTEPTTGTEPTTDDTDPTSDTTPDITPEPTLADVIVPQIASLSAPLIDGTGVTTAGAGGDLSGEWAAAIQIDNSGAPLLINKLQSSQNPDGVNDSPGHRWAAMHDGRYLYVVVLVDNQTAHQSDSDDAGTQNDSLELFLDADNSKLQRYDDNDSNYLLPLQDSSEGTLPLTDGSAPGVTSTLSSAVLFASGPGKGPAGLTNPETNQDIYEIRVSLTAIGINTDEPFGFELMINDDDGIEGFISQWSWNQPTGSNTDAQQNPSVFGTLLLE
ncbi:sugar-binding protein [Granulosicoccus antarcticus]|nr:sugar-binding protein [Granulosicoccus antarcticus]